MNYTSFNFITDLAHYIKPYRGKFFLAFFFRLTSDLAQLYPAFALSQITYLITAGKTDAIYAQIIQILIFWLASIFYKVLGREIAKYLGFQVAEWASLDLYRDCLIHIFALDLAWQEVENSGNKFKRINSGREGMNQTIRKVFGTFIEVGVNTFGIIAIFASQSIPIALALGFFMVSFYTLGVILLKKPSYHEQKASKKDENLGGITFEAFNNIRTIKSLAIDRSVTTIILKRIALLLEEVRLRIFWFRIQAGTLNLYYHLFGLFAVIFILYGIWHNNYKISLLVLFVTLFQQVGSSVWEMMEVTQDLVVSKIWVGRAQAILETKPEIEHPEKLALQVDFPQKWKEITIDHIKFTYHTQEVLQDISTSIKRGEKIGIVGISGSGKSTLFKLLMDLYETYDGDIYFDDLPLRDIKRQSYIDHVSVVLQETELFNMSLKENITITAVPGQRNDNKLLESVIKTAHLDDVISQLPQGLETLVGEKGIKLSGGQRQRVGIARALYRQPQILLLDEATSHLDVHSEKQIQQALHEAFGKCTAIVIAHRLSTIKEMDRIIVMQEGVIKEQGTFKELLKKKGIFDKMWQEQTI